MRPSSEIEIVSLSDKGQGIILREGMGVERDESSNNQENDACYCVRIARQLGLKLPFVDAQDLKPNSSPSIGGGVLFRYDDVSHIAVILRFTENGFLIKEGNFRKCKITKRFVQWNDPFIIGFWNDK